MDSTQLLVIRHGQSEWNATGRWQGHADPALSELGRRQSVVAAASIGAVDGIVSSDLLRAAETAAILGQQLGVGPVIVDDRLRERDVGEWSGLTRTEIESGWPGWLDDDRRPDGFEHSDVVMERVLEAFDAMRIESPGGSLLVITHGGVIRSLVRSHGLDDWPVANLAGVVVSVTAGGSTVRERISLLDGDIAPTGPNDAL
ncbi:MAG TPA: histidine phosphatase family protein [Ilumatobacteraceae bacterium]|jgi:broad specificity phosphatase PhoE